MTVKYEVRYNGFCHYVNVNEPNKCPICKHALKPTILNKDLIDNNKGIPSLYVTYLCNHCYKPFICQFNDLQKHYDFSHTHLYDSSILVSIEPNHFERITFESYINNISPSFSEIYNQALEAEHYKLDEIAGIGYRKALEFLIKDFLINHEKLDASKVKSTSLGCCIDTMINNPQLKITSSRATWLGNDQTHYEQKYTDKDIDDLKRLIELSVHWISMICLTDEAELIEKK